MKKTLSTFIAAGVVGLLAINVGGAEVKIPDPRFTSPHFCTVEDRDFKEFRYKQDIPVCERNVSYNTKTTVYSWYNVSSSDRDKYTVDHLIPLSLGGSNNIRNLWPQLRSQSTAPLEGRVYNKVRKGEITAQEAWNIILEVKYPDEI